MRSIVTSDLAEGRQVVAEGGFAVVVMNESVVSDTSEVPDRGMAFMVGDLKDPLVAAAAEEMLDELFVSRSRGGH